MSVRLVTQSFGACVTIPEKAEHINPSRTREGSKRITNKMSISMEGKEIGKFNFVQKNIILK